MGGEEEGGEGEEEGAHGVADFGLRIAGHAEARSGEEARRGEIRGTTNGTNGTNERDGEWRVMVGGVTRSDDVYFGER